jgi:hypothetical protein
VGKESNKLSKKLRKAINGVSRKLVLDTNRRLAEDTPVDTTFARSGWIPSTGSPTKSLPGTRDNVQQDAATSGVAQIQHWDLFKGPAFITNNVPYINRLNAGTSDQAPPGYVQNSIEKSISALSTQVLK